VKPSAYDDFEDDFEGFKIDAPEFRTAMHKAFWKGIVAPPVSSQIALDTTCFLTKDSTTVYDSATKMRFFLDTSRIDPGKVYLARTALEFEKYSMSIPGNLIAGRSPFLGDAKEKMISADMCFAIWDPASRRILYTDLRPSCPIPGPCSSLS